MSLGQRDRLISPLINLTDYREASLTFDYAYAQRFPQYTDSLIVYLTYDCGTQWVRLLQFGQDSLGNFATVDPTTNNFIPQSSADWCGSEGNPACPLVDLTPWKGYPDLRIVFESYNGFGNNIFIDNVKIEGTLSGISSDLLPEPEITLYPNPTNGTFTVKMKDYNGPANITVSDLTGRTVYKSAFDAAGEVPVSFSLSDSKKGIYLVEIKNSEKIWVRKLVVN
jgi:hypothetical protein